jgi:hypothetical protein
MSSEIVEEQQRAAKVAGAAYLLAFPCVVYTQFGIHDRLIVGSAAETARNILAHERLFRVGIVCDLLYCVGTVVLLAALYVVLKPVSRGLALSAAFWRLVYVAVWVQMTLNLFEGMRFVRGEDELRVFSTEQLQGLAMRALDARFDQYYVALLFCGLASTVCGYLWWRARYIPRVLAGFGVAASAFCVGCTAIFFVFPGFDKVVNLWWFDTPMGLFDIATSIWLLVRGVKIGS